MHLLQKHLLDKSESGRRRGIYSVCSAHRWLLRAAAEQAVEDGSLLLIESTSNVWLGFAVPREQLSSRSLSCSTGVVAGTRV